MDGTAALHLETNRALVLDDPVSIAVPGAARSRFCIAARSRWLPELGAVLLFGLAFSLRLWGLTQSVTADDQDWMGRAIGFRQAIEKHKLRDTYQSAHPGVPILWVASIVISPAQYAELKRLDDQEDMEQSSAYLPALARVRHAFAAYAAILTVVVTFLARRLFGSGIGALFGLLLAAEPFLVAHGQLFSTDTMLTLLMAISVLAALVYFERRGDRSFLVVSGLAAGLAFSTKAPAIILFGFIPPIGILWSLTRRRTPMCCERSASIVPGRARTLRALPIDDLVLWTFVAGLIYVAIWPALWVDPLGTLIRLEQGVRGVGESPRRWGNFFLGTIYPDDDVALLLRPIFYPVVTALRLSPITFIGVLTLAVVAFRKRRRAAFWVGPPRRCMLAVAAYVVLFTVMMSISPKKLDRYALPIYPALVLLAAVGLWWAIRRWLPSQWRWPTILVFGAAQVALVATVEPYPLSFYNPLLGGAAVAQQTMIVGWGEGLDQVAGYLNQQPDARRIVAVSLYRDQIVPLIQGKGARLPDWRKGNYLVSYVNMEQRGLIPAALQELTTTTSADFTVWINGIAYARVYRIPPEVRNRAGSEAGPRPNDVPRP